MSQESDSDMKIVSTNQMRELDRRAIEEFEISGETLMDRAGLGVANIVDGLFDRCKTRDPSILLIAGRGNNGGDAFVAARYLNDYGCNVMVWLAGSAGEVAGDARTHMNRMRECRIPFEELPTKEDWDAALEQYLKNRANRPDAVIDGVLGTGIKGPARGPAAGAISYINVLAGDSMVVSIDAPSGLDSDTGRAEGDAVKADITVTMGLPKRGLIEPRAAEHVGRLDVVDIGIPSELIDGIESDIELITAFDLVALFPKRARASHKGDYGRLLILGGAAGYSGAIAMATMAAIRSGAGLVTAVVPRSIAPVVSAAAPEAMVHGADETDTGSLAANCWRKWLERTGEFSGMVIGPGMTRHKETSTLVSMVLKDCAAPVVADADALNVFDGRLDELRASRREGAGLVITPHPGEMARLMGCSSADVQADRFAAARSAAERSGAVVVLKGAGTIVTQRGAPIHVNMTGNPGMARGGMGDVLAGLLGGLVAQGLSPLDAARAAVFLHGLAGDEAARKATESAMTTRDVIDLLPIAFKSVAMR